MSKGWISLHRQIWFSDIWQSPEPFDKRSAWVDLLLMVNHEDSTIIFDGKPETVKRGSVVTSKRKLAERWHWSRHKVDNYLNELQAGHMLSHISDKKRTTINVENYSRFQDLRANKEPIKSQKRSTNNKYNKLNKESAGYRRTESGLDKGWGE